MAACCRPEAIVLTGTIIPHGIETPGADPSVRRAEYLRSIQYYRQFAPVFFLENSTYLLADDPEFNEAADLHIRKFPLSTQPERGKGYQEFEMLDAWLAQEAAPPTRWLKITGRYLVRNIAAILQECSQAPEARLVIDQLARSRIARTYLFATDTSFYRQYMRSLYGQCDDRSGRTIEHVLGEALRADPEAPATLFATEPDISALAGSSGANLETTRFRYRTKQTLRTLNRLFDPRRMWYVR
jgi:hypothetical protein